MNPLIPEALTRTQPSLDFNYEPSPSLKATIQGRGQKSEKKHKKKKNKRKNGTEYHWNNIEQRRYVNFLALKKDLFEMSLRDKKANRIHLRMCKFIQTRTSNQCRSHHQKMLLRFGTIDNIIAHHRQLLNEKNTLKVEHLLKTVPGAQNVQIKQENKGESAYIHYSQMKVAAYDSNHQDRGNESLENSSSSVEEQENLIGMMKEEHMSENEPLRPKQESKAIPDVSQPAPFADHQVKRQNTEEYERMVQQRNYQNYLQAVQYYYNPYLNPMTYPNHHYWE